MCARRQIVFVCFPTIYNSFKIEWTGRGKHNLLGKVNSLKASAPGAIYKGAGVRNKAQPWQAEGI